MEAKKLEATKTDKIFLGNELKHNQSTIYIRKETNCRVEAQKIAHKIEEEKNWKESDEIETNPSWRKLKVVGQVLLSVKRTQSNYQNSKSDKIEGRLQRGFGREHYEVDQARKDGQEYANIWFIKQNKVVGESSW